jgi:hypothetical protein
MRRSTVKTPCCASSTANTWRRVSTASRLPSWVSMLLCFSIAVSPPLTTYLRIMLAKLFRRAVELTFAILALTACSGTSKMGPTGHAVTNADAVTDSAAVMPADGANRLVGKLFYAQQEEPNQFGYHVYLLFVDTRHFTWWRTKEPHESVLFRMDYYLNEHPGTNELTSFTMNGSMLEGRRLRFSRGIPSMVDYDWAQVFRGNFEDDNLTVQLEDSSGRPGGSLERISMVTWRLAPVTKPYQVPTQRPRKL